MYKNFLLASLFEVCVGTISLPITLLEGKIGLVLLSLLALRPLLLEKTSVVLGTFEKYYSVGKLSFVITFLTLIACFVSAEYLFQSGTNWKLIAMLILPYFVLNHGLAGLIYEIRAKKH